MIAKSKKGKKNKRWKIKNRKSTWIPVFRSTAECRAVEAETRSSGCLGVFCLLPSHCLLALRCGMCDFALPTAARTKLVKMQNSMRSKHPLPAPVSLCHAIICPMGHFAIRPRGPIIPCHQLCPAICAMHTHAPSSHPCPSLHPHSSTGRWRDSEDKRAGGRRVDLHAMLGLEDMPQ